MWPPATGGVWGYFALSFGNYDGGAPPVRVPPRQAKDISALRQDFRFSYTGSANFNLLTEFYLTAAAGDPKPKLIEVGVFLHAPRSSLRFFAQGKPIATYTDRWGQNWRIAQNGAFCMVMSGDGRDILQGSIDMKALLDTLRAQGVVKGNEWFNGLAFGMEPTPGGGRTTLRVDHWQVTYS